MGKRSSITPQPEAEGDARDLSSHEVAGYLREHPDFLLGHPDLLGVLAPPTQHSGNGVVDMQRFMIERLQSEIAWHNRHRDELLSSSRRNLSSQSRVHGAALEIIAAADFEQLVEVITTDLAVRLDVDVVRLCVELRGRSRPRTHQAGIRLLPPGTVDRVMEGDRQALLRRVDAPEPAIYGSAAPLVASEALLRLEFSAETPVGLLALGARNPDHFEPTQGTELLQFLARVIGTTIRSWLGLAA